MSEWRQIKLSVLLHAIDNDHSILLLHAPSGEYPTFRAIEDIPHSLFWGKREHFIIPIAGLRKSLVLAFCYENKFDLVNDTPEPLHRALGYRTEQSMSRSGYGEFYKENYHYKSPDDFQGYLGRNREGIK